MKDKHSVTFNEPPTTLNLKYVALKAPHTIPSLCYYFLWIQVSLSGEIRNWGRRFADFR